MPTNFSLILLFLLIAPPLVSCSKRRYTSKECECVELTEQSLRDFADQMKDKFAGSLADDPKSLLSTNKSYQQLCMRYLIGSAAVFGQADDDALETIKKICNSKVIPYLSGLTKAMARKNCCDAASKFIAMKFSYGNGLSTLGSLTVELTNDNWSAMRSLIAKVINCLLTNKSKGFVIRWILKSLSAGQKYELVDSGKMSMDGVSAWYSDGRFDPYFRELFVFARCSYRPNLKIREVIAERFPYFRQFLADGSAESTVSPGPAHVPELNNDIWYRISWSMDIETLVFVFPLVCRSWCDMHPRILMDDHRVHELYLLDLNYHGLGDIYKIAPWKYCLKNERNALGYLWCCIRDCGLDKIEVPPEGFLKHNMKAYMEAVIDGRVLPPRIKDCVTIYDTFLRLFEMIYQFSSPLKPALIKPAFLTDKEYEQAIHHLACNKGWILKLPESLVTKDLPRLFTVIDEDEGLIRKLILESLGEYRRSSLILLLQSQKTVISEKLLRAVFYQTNPFRSFVEPKFIQPSEYYTFAVETGVFFEMATSGYISTESCEMVISVVLFFRNNQDMIDKIVTAMKAHHPRHSDLAWSGVQSNLKEHFSKLLKKSKKYSSKDVEFVTQVLTRCELWDKRGA